MLHKLRPYVKFKFDNFKPVNFKTLEQKLKWK